MIVQKKASCLILSFFLFFTFLGVGQAAEADLVVLVGDIDNLGFGWPEGYDVFSGESTPGHGYPWQPGANDPEGTDQIMVVSSYKGNPPNGEDGYTGTTTRPHNLPKPIKMKYSLNGIQVNSATLQMFVDDFQAPVWKAKYRVKINGKRAYFLEDVLNSLEQTGPIGKLITVQILGEFLSEVAKGNLEIYIDDPVTGAGDGYAIDFIRLLINPHQYKYTSQLTGEVVDRENGNPLSGAAIYVANIVEGLTTENGSFSLKEIPAGLAVVTASKQGYLPQTLSIDLIANQNASLDFELAKAPVALNQAKISAIIGGVSHFDMLSTGEGFKEDGTLDLYFVADIMGAEGKTITNIEIRNTNGIFSVWDTKPNNGMWVVGVAKAGKPSYILNNGDGSVKIPVEKSREKLFMYVTDNGSIAGKSTNYKITVSFADGSKVEGEIQL